MSYETETGTAITIAGPLPTPDEILSGGTQGGIAPPPSFRVADDDGTVHSVVTAEQRAALRQAGHAEPAVAPIAAKASDQDACAAKPADPFDAMILATMQLEEARAEVVAARAAQDAARARLSAALTAMDKAEADFADAAEAVLP